MSFSKIIHHVLQIKFCLKNVWNIVASLGDSLM